MGAHPILPSRLDMAERTPTHTADGQETIEPLPVFGAAPRTMTDDEWRATCRWLQIISAIALLGGVALVIWLYL